MQAAARVGPAPLVTSYDLSSGPLRSGDGAARDAARLLRGRLKREAVKQLRFMQPTTAERVHQCGWCTFGNDVVLGVNRSTGRASYRGVKRCHGVWVCAECAARIAAARAAELERLLAYAAERGYWPVLLTLTFRHDRSMRCSDSLSMLKGGITCNGVVRGASRRLRSGRPWRDRVIPWFRGSVTSTEVTYGLANGWHPHEHILLLIEAPTSAAAVELVETMRPVWAACCCAEGLDGSHPAAFDVQDASAVSAYITKMGSEMTSLIGKTGRDGNRTPSELLAASADGDVAAGRVWQEYAATFKGRRALVWSPKLKDAAGIAEIADEAIADAAEEFVQLRAWSAGDRWRSASKRRLTLLTAAENGTSLDDAEFGCTDHERWQRIHAAGLT